LVFNVKASALAIILFLDLIVNDCRPKKMPAGNYFGKAPGDSI